MLPANPARIFIAHDDPIARAGLAATLQRYPDLEVVNADDSRAGQVPAEALPDVVIADYENGVAIATQTFGQAGLGEVPCKVMIVTQCDREWEIRSALSRGVRGYVMSGGALDDLVSAVRAVHRGARHLCPRSAQRLAQSLSGEALTEREEEVLRLVVIGSNNKMIGRRLGIAVATVKSHLNSAFDKLQVSSRTQAICVVERRGLLRDSSATNTRYDVFAGCSGFDGRAVAQGNPIHRVTSGTKSVRHFSSATHTEAAGSSRQGSDA
jgi:DNA-binding NarL/FixJ family response regulator